MRHRKTLSDHVLEFYVLFRTEKTILIYCVYSYFAGATVMATYFPHWCKKYTNYEPYTDSEGLIAGSIALVFLTGFNLYYLRTCGAFLAWKRTLILVACLLGGALVMTQTEPP